MLLCISAKSVLNLEEVSHDGALFGVIATGQRTRVFPFK